MIPGYMHMFATDENVLFNPFHEETTLADPVSQSPYIVTSLIRNED